MQSCSTATKRSNQQQQQQQHNNNNNNNNNNSRGWQCGSRRASAPKQPKVRDSRPNQGAAIEERAKVLLLEAAAAKCSSEQSAAASNSKLDCQSFLKDCISAAELESPESRTSLKTGRSCARSLGGVSGPLTTAPAETEIKLQHQHRSDKSLLTFK